MITRIEAEPAGVQNDRDHDRNREHTHALGKRPRNQKNRRRDFSHARTEAALHEFIGRVTAALENIAEGRSRKSRSRASKIAEHHLQENEAAGVGQRRCTDNRERAGFGGDDRKPDRPPGCGAAAQKIILQRPLPALEVCAKPRDPGEIRDDDCEIEWPQRDLRDCNRIRSAAQQYTCSCQTLIFALFSNRSFPGQVSALTCLVLAGEAVRELAEW